MTIMARIWSRMCQAANHSPILYLLAWSLGRFKADTQVSLPEQACLLRHAKNRFRVAEIGVWHGHTASKLRSVMAADGIYFAVDPFPRGRLGFSAQYLIARTEIKKIQRGRVVWLRCTGVEAAGRLKASGEPPLDFVFFDGDHSYDGLKADWEHWAPLIAPGGIAALHDSCPLPGRLGQDVGSVRFTRDVILKDAGFRLLETAESVTVLQKILC